MNRKTITANDLLSPQAYAAERRERRLRMIARKKLRRLPVGPEVTLYFENYDTMCQQIQEMMHAEKGGATQLADELAAYNPLIPQGSELVATMMIEIADEARRRARLALLGGIEHGIVLEVGGERAPARPEEDVERTTADGKTSAVHFLHFPLSPAMAAAFKNPDERAVLAIEHPEYAHMAVIPPAIRTELIGDLD